MAGKIDALLMGLSKLADELPGARRMVGNITDVGPIAPRIAALSEMVQKAASKAAKAADDWGWKGGKPGEITGGVFTELYSRVFPSGRLQNTAGLSESTLKRLRESPLNEDLTTEAGLLRAAYNQLPKGFELANRYGEISTPRLMEGFAILEKAGVPREWTGKIQRALPVDDWETRPVFDQFREEVLDWRGDGRTKLVLNMDLAAQGISDLMRPMTNDQRQAFLNLLPRWTGTLETAASAAKKLYRR